MDTELIQCLHKLSIKANRIILSEIDINHIDDEFKLDQFLDVNCYGLQYDLITAPIKESLRCRSFKSTVVCV